jgi:hypothetical protein
MRRLFSASLATLAFLAIPAHAAQDNKVSAKRLLEIQAEVDKGRGQLVAPDITGLSEAEKNAYYTKSNRCRNVGLLLQQLAAYRGSQTPEDTFRFLKGFAQKGEASIPETQIKRYINSAYSDPSFVISTSEAFSYEVADSCMHDWKPKFQTLK